jgi:hypothetical protein
VQHPLKRELLELQVRRASVKSEGERTDDDLKAIDEAKRSTRKSSCCSCTPPSSRRDRGSRRGRHRVLEARGVPGILMRQALRGGSVRASPRFRGGAQLNAGAGAGILTSGTIPAPYKGWDAISPKEDMDPACAVILDNWFPEPTSVRFRGGSTSWATGLGAGPVESLMPYHGVTTNKLFGARGTSIFDVTATGAVGAAAVSSLTNARWQHDQFTTPGGTFLFIVNGADAPRTFDGTSWATPSITGITASQAVHVNAHKRRIWMILKDSTKAAYLPTSSIAGAAQTFDLGPLMTKAATWSRWAPGRWTQAGARTILRCSSPRAAR